MNIFVLGHCSKSTFFQPDLSTLLLVKAEVSALQRASSWESATKPAPRLLWVPCSCALQPSCSWKLQSPSKRVPRSRHPSLCGLLSLPYTLTPAYPPAYHTLETYSKPPLMLIYYNTQRCDSWLGRFARVNLYLFSVEMAEAGVLTSHRKSGICFFWELIIHFPSTTHYCQHLHVLNKENCHFITFAPSSVLSQKYFKLCNMLLELFPHFCCCCSVFLIFTSLSFQ